MKSIAARRIGIWVTALGIAGGMAVATPSLARGRHRHHEEAGTPGRPAVTYAGFHVFDNGSSRVFVNVTAQVPVEITQKDSAVQVTLKGIRIGSRNNKHPLLTSHFVSSVQSARLVPNADDVDLLIQSREKTKAEHRVVTRPDGTATLEVDFAPLTTLH